MAELGWDARLNRPASSSTPGPAGETRCAPPPQVEAVLAQLQRWEHALRAEIQAETDGLASRRRAFANDPGASAAAEEEEKQEAADASDGSDIDVAAAMMAAAMC